MCKAVKAHLGVFGVVGVVGVVEPKRHSLHIPPSRVRTVAHFPPTTLSLSLLQFIFPFLSRNTIAHYFPWLSLEWVQFLSESLLQCCLMLQLWSAIRWITSYSLICLHCFYCFPQVMANMECAICSQPSYNCGRAERKSTSFTVVVVEGFEDSVVSLSSLCSQNLWSGCFIACAQDVLVWWN
jgi:hypothetical protein